MHAAGARSHGDIDAIVDEDASRRVRGGQPHATNERRQLAVRQIAFAQLDDVHAVARRYRDPLDERVDREVEAEPIGDEIAREAVLRGVSLAAAHWCTADEGGSGPARRRRPLDRMTDPSSASPAVPVSTPTPVTAPRV